MSTNNGINTTKPLGVAAGGTGQSSLTAHSVLVGNGTSGITQLTVGSNGMLLLGSTSADPAFATITSSAGSLTYTTGAASLNIDIANYVGTTSWTPILTFGAGGTTGITYGTQSGSYTRIANMVFVSFTIALTNKGSSTGTALVTNLPVTCDANGAAITARQAVLTYTGQLAFSVTPSATTITLQSQASGGTLTTLDNTAFANTTTLIGSGVYFV